MNIRKLFLLVFTVCMAAFCYGRDTSSYNIKDLIPIAFTGFYSMHGGILLW